MEIFPPSVQRPALLDFTVALGSRDNALRRDECGDWRINSSRGHIYAVPEGFQFFVMGWSAKGSNQAKRALSFAKLCNDGDDVRQLQGTSLDGAQLQGASLYAVELNAADLSSTLLWRTHGSFIGPSASALRLDNWPKRWLPFWRDDLGKLQRWNDKAYQDLREKIEPFLAGAPRNRALDRVPGLDCANTDKTLASCDPSDSPPAEAAAWQTVLEGAGVGDLAYARALAAELQRVVCSGGDGADYVLRGVLRALPFEPSRLAAAHHEVPGLVDFIMSKKCPVSALLTDSDRAYLLSMKQNAIELCEGEMGVFRRSRIFRRCVGAAR